MFNLEIHKKILNKKLHKIWYDVYEFKENDKSDKVELIIYLKNRNLFSSAEKKNTIFYIISLCDKLFWTKLFWEYELKENESFNIELDKYLSNSFEYLLVILGFDKNQNNPFFKLIYRKTRNIKRTSAEMNDVLSIIYSIDEALLKNCL